MGMHGTFRAIAGKIRDISWKAFLSCGLLLAAWLLCVGCVATGAKEWGDNYYIVRVSTLLGAMHEAEYVKRLR